MNIQHLKYIIEIDNAKSINKASENLYMSQPNLSRILKDLEESLNIVIFKRTAKGMELTDDGAEFISYARLIVGETERLETFCGKKTEGKLAFSVSLPRANYISDAFVNFLNGIDKTKKIEFNYKETNAVRVITNVEQNGFNLGIIRYKSDNEEYYQSLFEEKSLEYEKIFSFNYVILTSSNGVLGDKKIVTESDLVNLLEISHDDPYAPSVLSSKKKFSENNAERSVNIFERGSRFELIPEIPESYTWSSPVPQNVLTRYNLTEKSCVGFNDSFTDVIVHKKNYNLTELDKKFIACVHSSAADAEKTFKNL